ncbi:hypothetical protein CL656_06100 [bacterium]|nr:hypothetical protein [bacterium]
MVFIHNNPFPTEKYSIVPGYNVDCLKFENYFKQFNFELSNFQKWSIYSIINNDNTLVTAHTGSGKTLPAEFAIQYFTSLGKKVIYTSPIKALSNQKFFEFTQKYKNLSIGILTGDNKHNPEADVIVMTTEILRNQLLSLIPKTNDNEIPVHEINQFSMDIEKDCGIVIFDEIHYIDDPDRGAVWEQSIMHLPKNIPMLMLSASIGKPEQFAEWIESINPDKKVNICPTYERVVPLEHYSYITIPDSCFDKIKDKTMKTFFEENLNKLNILKDSKNVLNETQFVKIQKIKNNIELNNFHIHRKFVLNNLLNYLKKNIMLPALCFVFSRKQVERLAGEITEKLWSDEELYEDPIPNTIEKTCIQILVSRITNWKEYVNMPEFHFLIKCLKNGVGFHHAGMIPVFKEMIEILFSMKKIKLLIATETFAVGLNMPTKTVIFTSIYKYNGNTMRLLEGHEYTQMAGRAGRRNIDTRGYIIHLNNLFDTPDSITYKHMINCPPKIIKSRFKIGIPFIMNIIASSNYQECPNSDILCKHIEKSMMMNDINNEINNSSNCLIEINKKIEDYQKLNGDKIELFVKYASLKNNIIKSKNKQKRRAINELKQFEENHQNIQNDYDTNYSVYINLLNEKVSKQKHKNYAEQFINNSVLNILNILNDNQFINCNSKLTVKGKISSLMMEVHGLVFAELYMLYNGFEDLDYIEIGQLLSCFYPIKVPDDKKCINIPDFTSYKLTEYLKVMKLKMDYFYDEEVKYNLDVGYSYEYQYDLIDYIKRWCNVSDEKNGIMLLNEMKNEKEIFVGDFVKCCIKITNITREMKTICEFTKNYDCLEKINNLEKYLIKFIISTESLYL